MGGYKEKVNERQCLEVKYPEHIRAFMGGKLLFASFDITDLDTDIPSPMPDTVRGSIDPTGGVRFHPVVCFEAPVIALDCGRRHL